MLQTRHVEKIKTHFMFNNFYASGNRDIYEITWKNNVQRGTPQTKIWRMRIAC